MIGSTFVHLFEWSWVDIARECTEFLGPKGYAAVQISPPMEHISGEQWWTRYQPVSYKLESRSGTAAEFATMVATCDAAGVAIYADAVLNHGAAGSGVGINGTAYGNPPRTIHNLYSQPDYHHVGSDLTKNCAVSNYDDKHNVQYCDLVGLPDLCTSCDYVRKTTAAYVDHMASLGVKGIRLDAAKHMDAGELAGLLAEVQSFKSLFTFQEVISGSGEAVTPSMYYGTGSVTEFKYGTSLGTNFVEDGKVRKRITVVHVHAVPHSHVSPPPPLFLSLFPVSFNSLQTSANHGASCRVPTQWSLPTTTTRSEAALRSRIRTTIFTHSQTSLCWLIHTATRR